jgi:ubiquinone/menaquinone biosynthesis C-methylase UbiE
LNYYDNIAPIYDETRWMSEAVAEKVADVMLEVVDANPSTSFLEPGVGTGLNVFPLVNRGYSVTGIDVSSNMLNQFRHKFNGFPKNLTLLRMDASTLSFSNGSFDVILTVHMIHTVSDWKIFLNEIERVLKPNGYYLNAQWINPPHRIEFDGYFRSILNQYKSFSNQLDIPTIEINVDKFFREKNWKSSYLVAHEWFTTNTVEELLSYYQSRAYGICWQIRDDVYHQVMKDFTNLCIRQYGSLRAELSSNAKFEIWAYTASRRKRTPTTRVEF